MVLDLDCYPVIGIPPEDIWMTYTIMAGNLKVNDKGPKIYADDSTNGYGVTRLIPSFSGCGRVRLTLRVRGNAGGTKTLTVRTTDSTGNGRTDATDAAAPCDLNYNKATDATDSSLTQNHVDHWKRNALHGTLVRRTNLCESPPNCVPRVGESELFWSPNGRWLTFSEHISTQSCKIFMAPSDPNYANVVKQFTFVAPDSSDYDGSWSPLGHEIVFDREDYRILKKGIPGLAVDTSEILVTVSGDPVAAGDLTPAVSPNGQWVAFSRKNARPGFSLWKVPIAGGSPTQLTSASGEADFYPRWSPDGEWIVYQRELSAPIRHSIRKVMATGAADQEVYAPGMTSNAANPAYSADGAILTGAIGTAKAEVIDTRTYTIDPLLATKKPILNYPGHVIGAVYPFLFPRISPDGTRLGLITRQIWAVRRNMNLPPQFTTVTSTNEGLRSVVDTAATMDFTVYVKDLETLTLQASDPEPDTPNTLTYQAAFLESWMVWDGINTLTFVSPPPSASGKTFYVKFWVTTASGGTDALIAVIRVINPPGGLSAMAMATVADAARPPDGPNPTRGEFALTTPVVAGTSATLVIFDLSGRPVRAMRGPSGSQLVWDGRDRGGTRAAPGVYLYRLIVGMQRREGKVVVIK